MTDTQLRFLTNDAGEDEGLGDAGIETFRDRPYASCARETGQNSKDASQSSELPVRVTFDVLELPVTELPAVAEYRLALQACASKANGEKENEFFGQASAILKKATIKILRIADYNTKGLTGPPEKSKTAFHSLVKSAGVSSEKTETSGGSFGIGKNAAFAVSDLQYVLYSTTYKTGREGTDTFIAQGKVKLVSHTDKDGKKLRATGYWGHPDEFRAITDQRNVPEWMRRTETGTSIFAAGFRETDDWHKRMAYSLIANFFCAVHRNEMVFSISNDTIKIDRDNLPDLFVDATIRSAAESAGHAAELEFASQLYECLKSPSTRSKEHEIPGLGTIRIHILVNDDYPRRVGIVRNGMLITDTLEHFGDQLKRFQGSKPFVAIVEPLSDEASRMLKRLENPQHNGFSAGRISDPGKQKLAERAMKNLAKAIREFIRDETAVAEDSEITLDELSQFFAETSPKEKPKADNGEEDPERITYKVAKRIPRSRVRTTGVAGGTGGGGGGGKHVTTGGGGIRLGEKTGGGSGGSGKNAEPRMTELREVRNLFKPSGTGDRAWRTVHFTPTETGKTSISFQASGINNSEDLAVEKCSVGDLAGRGEVVVELVKDKRTSMDVRFREAYSGPLEVEAMLQPAPAGEAT